MPGRVSGSYVFAVIALLFASRVAVAADPVTEEETQALAHQIDRAAAVGETYPLVNAFSNEEFHNRLFQGFQFSEKVKASFLDSPSPMKGLAAQLKSIIRAGGTFRLVRVRAYKGGEYRPLFRLTSPQGLNYHELILFRDDAGQVRIADLYIHAAGETQVQNMRNMLTQLHGKDGKSMPPPAEQQALANAPRLMAEIRKLVGEGKGQPAKALYAQLPAKIKASKAGGMIFVSISALLGEQQHAAALEMYRQRYPNGAEIDLLTIDVMALKNDWDGMLDAVDRVDQKLGGDPYLDLFRANAHIGKGDLATGRELLAKATAALPWMKELHDVAVGAALEAKDWDGVAAALTAAERDAGVQWSNLENTPAFTEFIETPQYKNWKKQQRKR